MREILDPAKEYENEFKEEHSKKADEYLESLVKESGLDVEANKKTMSEIDDWNDRLSKTSSKKSGFIVLDIILAVIAVIGLLVCGLFIYNAVVDDPRPIVDLSLLISVIIAVCGLILAAGLITIMATVMRKTIKTLTGKQDEANSNLDRLHKEAREQMKAFNDLFDWRAPLDLWNKTIEIAQLDPYYDYKKYSYVKNKYKVKDLLPNESTLFVQSGSIVGNPFFVYQKLIQNWKDVVYTGSIVITWTEYVRDSEGHSTPVTQTETLTAQVVQPAPDYSEQLNIFYANDAAPKLSFSRKPSHIKWDLDSKSDIKQLEKINKSLDKRTTKAIKSGETFNVINGDYFEAMFNCQDRNNENEYRLLFTPAARRSMIDIMSSNDGYGDDFSFVKEGGVNLITPEHLKEKDITLGTDYYTDESYEAAKEKFKSFNENYFRSLYFGLAPILAIPLYQEYKPAEYIYKDTIKQQASPMQYESIAYHYDENVFKHEQSITRNIIKTELDSHNKDTDIINVTSHGFKGVDRVTIVPVWGGDGRYHDVPVNWIEYLPVQKTTPMVAKTTDKLNSHRFRENLRDNNSWRDFFRKTKRGSETAKYNRDIITFIGDEGLSASDLDKEMSKLIDRKDK